jgi:hypothetical protein
MTSIEIVILHTDLKRKLLFIFLAWIRERKVAACELLWKRRRTVKYLHFNITNRNLIQEEIKKRLNSGNACYHSVQNLLSSQLLCKRKN